MANKHFPPKRMGGGVGEKRNKLHTVSEVSSFVGNPVDTLYIVIINKLNHPEHIKI